MRVDLAAGINEQLADFEMGTGRGQYERTEAFFVAMFNVGAALNEQRDERRVAADTRNGERGVVVCVRLEVDVVGDFGSDGRRHCDRRRRMRICSGAMRYKQLIVNRKRTCEWKRDRRCVWTCNRRRQRDAARRCRHVAGARCSVMFAAAAVAAADAADADRRSRTTRRSRRAMMQLLLCVAIELRVGGGRSARMTSAARRRCRRRRRRRRRRLQLQSARRVMIAGGRMEILEIVEFLLLIEDYLLLLFGGENGAAGRRRCWRRCAGERSIVVDGRLDDGGC